VPTARYIIGDSLDVLRSLPDQSVNCVVTSPPYLNLRSYLPSDHPSKGAEIGQEARPADFIESLLIVMDEAWRVLRDDGTVWINLGDTASGSGGAGGDYTAGGLRDGQQRYLGSARKRALLGIGDDYRPARSGRKRSDWPRAKSVCWVPQLFGASLAYGRNLLSGQEHEQWITRQEILWVKPNPPVGQLIDKFRPADERIVFAVKQGKYAFDLDAVRTPHKNGITEASTAYSPRDPGRGTRKRKKVKSNPLGAPPLTWWQVATSRYKGSHFATFPPALIVKPIIAGCPKGGVVLDPFAGSGTTLLVANGAGRHAIGIDIDERNAELAAERVENLTVEYHQRLSDAA
jgi:DNA modification methylase